MNKRIVLIFILFIMLITICNNVFAEEQKIDYATVDEFAGNEPVTVEKPKGVKINIKQNVIDLKAVKSDPMGEFKKNYILLPLYVSVLGSIAFFIFNLISFHSNGIDTNRDIVGFIVCLIKIIIYSIILTELFLGLVVFMYYKFDLSFTHWILVGAFIIVEFLINTTFINEAYKKHVFDKPIDYYKIYRVSKIVEIVAFIILARLFNVIVF